MKICYSCEYSNEFGYCKFSACKKQSSITDTTNEGLQQQLSQLQQEKEDLIKWLKTEYMCFDNESDERIIARQILSKLKESDK